MLTSHDRQFFSAVAVDVVVDDGVVFGWRVELADRNHHTLVVERLQSRPM